MNCQLTAENKSYIRDHFKKYEDAFASNNFSGGWNPGMLQAELLESLARLHNRENDETDWFYSEAADKFSVELAEGILNRFGYGYLVDDSHDFINSSERNCD